MKRNPNPNYPHYFQTTYIPDQQQTIRVEIWEEHVVGKDTLFGWISVPLKDIINDKKNYYYAHVVPLTGKQKAGKICMRAGNVKLNNVKWSWQGIQLKNMDAFSESDPFLQFYYLDDNNVRYFVGQSNYIQDNNNPIWQSFEIPIRFLCRNNLNRKFQIEVKDWEESENHKTIGSIYTSIKELIERQNVPFNIVNKKGNFAGYLVCKTIELTDQELIDFLD